jgi:uncharacterized membrane protein YdjX (TVP38/TMEM64 family)
MVETIEKIISSLTNIIERLGPLAGLFVIVLESIIPILPLAAIIALNNIVFGPFFGFLISWVGTIIGCLLSFFAFRLGFNNKLYRRTKTDGKTQKFMKYITKVPASRLTLLIAIPFTPAFAVNIAAGLSKISFKKYFISILIGKISIVYFWGYIGTSLIESVKNPIILIRIAIMVGIAYSLSLFIQKYLEMKGVK